VSKNHIVLHSRANAPLATLSEHLIAQDKHAEKTVDAAVPANTRRAYELELACFASWCTRNRVNPMPADPRALRIYLFELADIGRAPEDVPSGKPKGPMGYSALMRTLSAICRSHRKSRHISPWDDPVITETREALAVIKGTAPKKQKRDIGAVGDALIFSVCDLMEKDGLRGTRDRAMLLVGLQGGGRRRSEIAAARLEHFETVQGGLRWVIPRSKTDQAGKGLEVGLTPTEDKRYCPVHALQCWLAASKIESGPVFRGIDPAGSVMSAPLAPKGVAQRIQHYVKELGLDPSDFGGHSLRSGFVTTAYKLGRKFPDIMQATGHRTVEQAMKYVRRAGLIEESAGRGLMDEALIRRRSNVASSPVGAAGAQATPDEALRRKKKRRRRRSLSSFRRGR